MATNGNAQLLKLAISLVSVAAVAGVAGRLSVEGSPPVPATSKTASSDKPVLPGQSFTRLLPQPEGDEDRQRRRGSDHEDDDEEWEDDDDDRDEEWDDDWDDDGEDEARDDRLRRLTLSRPQTLPGPIGAVAPRPAAGEQRARSRRS